MSTDQIFVKIDFGQKTQHSIGAKNYIQWELNIDKIFIKSAKKLENSCFWNNKKLFFTV